MGGDELYFLHEASESSYIAPLGPQVDAFEREFCEKVGISYAAAVSSGLRPDGLSVVSRPLSVVNGIGHGA